MKNIIITTVVAATLSISSVSFAKDKIKIEKDKCDSVQQEELQTKVFKDKKCKAFKD